MSVSEINNKLITQFFRKDLKACEEVTPQLNAVYDMTFLRIPSKEAVLAEDDRKTSDEHLSSCCSYLDADGDSGSADRSYHPV